MKHIAYGLGVFTCTFIIVWIATGSPIEKIGIAIGAGISAAVINYIKK